MEIESKIKVYQLDGKDVPVGLDNPPMLSVKNIQFNDKMILIEIDGKKARVLGYELQRAITNALH